MPTEQPCKGSVLELIRIVAAWDSEGLGTCHGLDRTNWPDAWEDVVDHVRLIAYEMGEEVPATHAFEADPEDASCDHCGRDSDALIHVQRAEIIPQGGGDDD